MSFNIVGWNTFLNIYWNKNKFWIVSIFCCCNAYFFHELQFQIEIYMEDEFLNLVFVFQTYLILRLLFNEYQGL